jgi:hypothetical protein
MTNPLANADDLSRICHETEVIEDHKNLLQLFTSLFPELEFSFVLTRGNWHRLGGIVDMEYQRISDNIATWAENECSGDVDQIISEHLASGYFATRLSGKTHFFTAPCGDNIEDFIQLEVEELIEVIDHPLVDKDWFPDSLEEFIDPLDYPRLEPETVGKAYYKFRRISSIAELFTGKRLYPEKPKNLQRFFHDWQQSSAMENKPFCHYWVLALREYKDCDGDIRLTVKPVSTYADKLPDLPPSEQLHGTELSQAIHNYDRQLGYPFAWYFIMLSSKASNYSLAEAVLRDQMGAYDYLPAKDLNVLRQWEEKPYGV